MNYEQYLRNNPMPTKTLLVGNPPRCGKTLASTIYKHYEKEAYKQAYYINTEVARMLLKLPIPMSYEVWCFLHEQLEREL